MLVPYFACLLLPLDILVDFKTIVSIAINFKTLGNLHVHVAFNWSLGKGHYKVNLLGMPALDNSSGKDKADATPCGNWCKCVPVFASFDLEPPVNLL